MNKPLSRRRSGIVPLILFAAVLCGEVSSRADPLPQPSLPIPTWRIHLPCGLQEDNLSGKAIYRMRIRSASPDRLVYDTENTGTIRYLLPPMFRPGGMRTITFLDREPQDVWRYYSITRTGRNANPLTAGNEASSVNRAVAFYRYLAGIPTDKGPPASP